MLGFNKNQIVNFIYRFSVLTSLVIIGGIGIHWYLFFEFRGSIHSSDEVLIKNLELHTEPFQYLISMFREDSPTSVVNPTWISPKNVISADRWAEYKKLFKALNLKAGMRSWGGDSIYFISTAAGLVTGGSNKGTCTNQKHLLHCIQVSMNFHKTYKVT